MRQKIRPLLPMLVLVALVGFVGGWTYSGIVVGHARSPQGGYFGNLSSLDWVGWLVQDIVLALLGSVAAIGVFLIARLVLSGSLKNSRSGNWLAAGIAILVVGGSYAGKIAIHLANEAQRHVENEREGQRVATATKSEKDRCKAAFDGVGWVKYPSLKGEFVIQGCYATMTPSDPPDTVIQYYLSRAETWQPEPASVRCVVRCGDYLFRVELPRQGGPATVFANAIPSSLARKGPAKWPEDSTPPPSNAASETAVDIGPVAYPGATRDESGGKMRFWTHDDMATVRKYYESIHALDHSLNKKNLSETQSFELKVGRRTAYISIMPGATQEPTTLIEVLWH